MSITQYHEELSYKLVDSLYPVLEFLKEEAEAIAGEWNGDEAGTLEDRATTAAELIDLIDRMKEVLGELS
jgi:hypothetical protein